MSTGTTFLQLPPELGAVRYGPFNGVIRVGSDTSRNQIVLDPSMGIYPDHATIADLDNGTYTVGPAARDCKVFLLQSGQAHAWPIHAPVQARAGDTVIFGTPQGPRFQIQRQVRGQRSAGQIMQGARQTGGDAGFVQAVDGMMSNLYRPAGSGIAGEVQRRAQAQMLANAGPLRSLYVFWTRFRSGAFSNPYYIVGALMALVGLVGTGSVSCSGVLYVIWDSLGLGM